MKKLNYSPVVTVLTLLAFTVALFFVPTTAEAKWQDNSDELPGMNDFPTTLVIVAGGLVVATTVFLLVRKGSKDKGSEEIIEQQDVNKTDSTNTVDTDQIEKTDQDYDEIVSFLGKASPKSSLGFMITLDQVEKTYSLENTKPDFSDIQLNVGITLGF